MSNNQHERGSEWRRWDLHIHTPCYFHEEFKIHSNEKDKYGDDKWAKYIDVLEQVQDVSVIGITDYFSIEGYKKILKYKNEGKLNNFDLILPNIEFRLDIIGTDRKKINFHVIFSDCISAGIIERDFLNKLQFYDEMMNPKTLCRENIEEFGQEKKKTGNFQGNNYAVGCNNIQFKLDDILKILENGNTFKGKYIFVLAEEGWNTLEFDCQQDHIKTNLLFHSHSLFTSNPSTIKWLLGEKEGTSADDFHKRFGSLKPAIHGSDAHKYEKICKPDEDRYCWIKADPTFEGLKTIIYEPRDRVKIQKDMPEKLKNIYCINDIKISNSKISNDLSINEDKISINNNLVAITGGKGSGKTAILDLIANCFTDRCKRDYNIEDKNSFIQRIETDKGDLCVQLGFKGENINNFSKMIIDESFMEETEITYLPQGKIEEISSNHEELNEQIKKIIFKDRKIIENRYESTFNEKLDEVKDIQNKLTEKNLLIFNLQEETKEDIFKNINSEIILKKGELKNKREELEIFTKNMKEDLTEKIDDLNDKEESINDLCKLLKDTKGMNKDLHIKITDFSSEVNNEISNINENIIKIKKEMDINELSNIDLSNELKIIFDINQTLSEKINHNKKDLESIKNQKNDLMGDSSKQTILIEEIRNIKLKLSENDEKLINLNNKRNEIVNLENERIKLYYDLLDKYGDIDTVYSEMIELFSKDKDEILKDVKFESMIYFDYDSFYENGKGILHGNKISDEEISYLGDDIKNLLKSKDTLKDLVNNISELKTKLKSSSTDLELYNWFFNDYFSQQTEIYFNNQIMDKLSLGQKGTVLLKLFLGEGTYPLIIDQPEDNLDNRFIYDELVGAIKKAKTNRQIIIATNNANLLVNADAEQVIVAEFNENLISYKRGSLENLNIRSHLMPILEGGEKAFREREEKYGIAYKNKKDT